MWSSNEPNLSILIGSCENNHDTPSTGEGTGLSVPEDILVVVGAVRLKRSGLLLDCRTVWVTVPYARTA